jgi:prefoldin subunit 5
MASGDVKEKVEEAIASIEAKRDAISGNPPDLSEELDAIREAVGIPVEKTEEAEA